MKEEIINLIIKCDDGVKLELILYFIKNYLKNE
ncbi:hypothetical protein IYC_06551 [Clostridium sporogenes PA 3679]|nr:hypothetical protein IYC_06551 [Clostridium sporogenes PA 3679]